MALNRVVKTARYFGVIKVPKRMVNQLTVAVPADTYTRNRMTSL